MTTTPGTQYALFEVAEASPLESPPADNPEARFSDYVVYVDESGDHSLASINPDFPVFVLALCVIHKRHYAEKIIPAVEKLKFNYLKILLLKWQRWELFLLMEELLLTRS